MPLLDGKYEILWQQAVDERQTLFRATAPDGEPVRIAWFELGADQERSFERYRRALRHLSRDGDTLLRDVVSRPGAHYVVWDDPGDAPPVEDGAWGARLRERGLDPADAEIRRIGRRPHLAGLAWDGRPLPPVRPPAPAVGDPPASASPRRPRLRIPPQARSKLLAALLLACSALLMVGGWLRASNDAVAVVPDLVGASAQQAAERLHASGLRAEPVPTPSDDAAGTVLGLEPPVGTEVRPGREVRLLYAVPPGQLAPAEVPSLRGLAHPEETEAALQEVGLELGRTARVPADEDLGVVLAQSPAAGRELGQGQEVDVLVSTGPTGERSFVPDLVGLPLEEARALARLAGLAPDRVEVDRIPTPERPSGEVLTQSLAPYRSFALDRATLRLTVSAGAEAPDEGGAPNLVGMSQEQVEAFAEAEGLDLRRTFVGAGALPEGVILQEPAPGEPLDGPLSLTVNAHPVPVPEPEVRATVLRPSLRRVPYRLLIEPGIPEQTAELYAITLDGERRLVTRETVEGGTYLEGNWITFEPGRITFELFLNDQFYTRTTVSP